MRAHFVQLDKKLTSVQLSQTPEQLDLQFVERTLQEDSIFDHLVVQRSRAYVKESQKQLENGQVLFPERGVPQVVEYKLKATYGRLLESVERAFNKEKPLFVLGIYYPLFYWKGNKDEPNLSFDENRQRQVVGLIRTQFLKRLESSAGAFEMSCWRLLKKLLAWVEAHGEGEHEARRLERWKTKHHELIGYVHAHQHDFWLETDESATEDFLTDEEISAVERLDPEQYNIGDILDDSYDDLDQLAEFLQYVGQIKPEKDDKLKALTKLLKSDKSVAGQKVIVFTEFADTADYVFSELKKASFGRLEKIDGSSNQRQRSDVIRRFSPYYNGADSAAVTAEGKEEINVLISTDVLAEGLNLQDATRLINYDLNWNPVRLMQRIGRVDRRMHPAVEARIKHDHPEAASSREKIIFWNFLPPKELDNLLRLYKRVNQKVLIISRTLGIEHGKLLHPDDEYELIKEINKQFDGEQSETEILRLEYNRLLKDFPEAAVELDGLPLKVFSGKEHPQSSRGSKAVFFCFRVPRPDPALIPGDGGELRWSESAGFTVWVCCDPTGEKLITDPAGIADLIRSMPETSRHCAFDRAELSTLRKKMEKEVTRAHLRALQAPPGVTPILKCWMGVKLNMSAVDRLRQIRKFPDLIRYLEDELDWPMEDHDFDELTFEYDPEELGLKDVDAAKIKTIHQLRPLSQNQPWGIFFVEFEKKKLPVVVLRRILSHLVLRKRASANKADAKRWGASDLLFISAFGDERTDQREIAFAHFHQEDGDLPTLRVLGWDGADTPLHVDYVAQVLQSRRERQKVGGQAALRSGSCVCGCDLNFGYQRRNRSSRSSLRTLVLVCSKR